MAVFYVVATPIGNLEDITLRALRILKEVDLIACEDTRITKRLLDRYQIDQPVISYHQHSDAVKVNQIIDELKAGKDVALVSEAGTPGISDPGNKLVAAVVAAGIRVVPIPGPTAGAAALSVAGFSTDSFIFLGFIPHKKRRRTLLKEISQEKRTVVFYESPYRIVKALEQLTEYLEPDRQVVVCRELTKMFEEIVRGNIKEVLKQVASKEIKGEFVVVVAGK